MTPPPAGLSAAGGTAHTGGALNIALLAAGAAGMYCGSCLRDNGLAVALQRLGQQVTLVPLYTPLRTDAAPAACVSPVYYGAINAYLQSVSPIFRHTPRLMDWPLDRPSLLTWAGKMGTSTPPARLAKFTLGILAGELGPTAKELRRLVSFLKREVKPQIVSLPNLMFVGMARLIRRELDVPIVCELTGEDIFLDAMGDTDRAAVRRMICDRAADVDRFVATSRYYAGHAAEYLGISENRISVVYPGVSQDYLAEPAMRTSSRPPTVGYLARICPEKGLDRLLDAMQRVKQMPGLADVRLRVAGYVGPGHRQWYLEQQTRMAGTELNNAIAWHGEVTLSQKLNLLDGIDVLSVPTVYPESKGLYVLESLARSVPVVQPNHGAFPELIARTGGGLLAPPGDAEALADRIAELLLDEPRRLSMGTQGRGVVQRELTDDHMAAAMLTIYRELLQ